MYKLKEVFTFLKLNITTGASKFMSEDQFDVREGLNLKMQFKCAFICPYFAEMINPYGIFIKHSLDTVSSESLQISV